jgi:hypothetical protein
MKRTFGLLTGLIVGFVHFQVDVGSGSKILTRSVDRSHIRKSAVVVGGASPSSLPARPDELVGHGLDGRAEPGGR